MPTTFQRAYTLAALLRLKESRTETGQRAWACPFAAGRVLTADEFFAEKNLLGWLLCHLPQACRLGYELTTVNDRVHKAAVWRLGAKDRVEVCNASPLLALVDALCALRS